jgi:protein-tyrosine-phosphatase
MCARNFSQDHPLSYRNVFVMMRFEETSQHEEILTAVRGSLDYYGFDAFRADDMWYFDNLWGNVRVYMEGCQYGIAVFDQIYERDFNPNVSLELGYMMGQGKECLVLKEEKIPTLPSDLSGRLYRVFDSYDIERTIREQISQWMRDLHIVPDEDKKLVVFVSTAGIDRCAMAKAILNRLLEDNPKVASMVRVESAGKYKPYHPRARKSGCIAIQDVCGEDRLSSHEPQILSDMLKEKADLILVMADSLKRGLPPSKTFNFKEFFGLEGDVRDPVTDNEDAASLEKYKRLATELKGILENERNFGKIVEYLEVS